MRRELVEILAPLFHKHFPAHANSIELNEECTTVCPYEISAAEKFAPEIERLLAQEREKVREMCLGTLRNLRRLLKDISSEGEETFRICGEKSSALYKAEKEIRQLDLTKDLADRSTEEGK